jgi:hypothetical protein
MGAPFRSILRSCLNLTPMLYESYVGSHRSPTVMIGNDGAAVHPPGLRSATAELAVMVGQSGVGGGRASLHVAIGARWDARPIAAQRVAARNLGHSPAAAPGCRHGPGATAFTVGQVSGRAPGNADPQHGGVICGAPRRGFAGLMLLAAWAGWPAPAAIDAVPSSTTSAGTTSAGTTSAGLGEPVSSTAHTVRAAIGHRLPAGALTRSGKRSTR